MRSPFPKTLGIWRVATFLGIVPFTTYIVLWLPHLNLNPEGNLFQLHQKMFVYHSTVSHTSHAYCSAWYTWPLMLRPVSYFHQISTLTSTKPVIYDVRAMGNPILWWLASLAAIVALVSFFRWLSYSTKSFPKENWPLIYLSINYFINWLPWIFTNRCTFIYHYLPAVSFSFLVLAWYLHKWLDRQKLKPLVFSSIILIAIAFGFWLPIYLGLPLSPESWQLRMFLPEWI